MLIRQWDLQSQNATLNAFGSGNRSMNQCDELHRIEVSPSPFRSHVRLGASCVTFWARQCRPAELDIDINRLVRRLKVDRIHLPILIQSEQ
jgi:hypothetical protein